MNEAVLMEAFRPLLKMMNVMGFYFTLGKQSSERTAGGETKSSREDRKVCFEQSSSTTRIVRVKVSSAPLEDEQISTIEYTTNSTGSVNLEGSHLSLGAAPDVEGGVVAAHKGRKVKTFFQRTHGLAHLLLTVYLTLQVAATIWVLDTSLEGITPIRIITTVWMMQCTSNTAIFFRASFGDWLSRVFEGFGQFHEECVRCELDLTDLYTRLRRVVRKLTILMIVAMVIFGTLPPIMLLLVPEGQTYAKNMVFPFDISPVPLCFLMLMFEFPFAFWICVEIFIVEMTYCLTKYFQFIADAMKCKQSADEAEFCGNLGVYRELYLQITDITNVLNRYVGLVFAMLYLLSITIVVFMGYIFVKSRFGVGTTLVLLVWVLVQFSCVVVTSLSCCSLNQQVRKTSK